MELEQEESGLVAPLVAQALMEDFDERRFVGESDGMGEAVGVAEYGSELGNSTVDAVMHFGPVTEPTELESELVTELETVGSSDHLHKIDQIVLQVKAGDDQPQFHMFSEKFGQRPGNMAKNNRSGSTVRRSL